METSGSKSPRALANPAFIMRLLAAVLLIGLIAWQAMCSPAGWAAAPGQQDSGVGLANADQESIDRRGDGGFVARPVFNPQPDFLGYGVKDPVDGSWLTAVYLVQGGPRRVSEGWEYTIEYPTLDAQPRLDPDRAYTLVLFASRQGQLRTFEQTIPVYQPSRLWDRVLNTFNPATWAKAVAGWVIEGVHGVICSVVIVTQKTSPCTDGPACAHRDRTGGYRYAASPILRSRQEKDFGAPGKETYVVFGISDSEHDADATPDAHPLHTFGGLHFYLNVPRRPASSNRHCTGGAFFWSADIVPRHDASRSPSSFS